MSRKAHQRGIKVDDLVRKAAIEESFPIRAVAIVCGQREKTGPVPAKDDLEQREAFPPLVSVGLFGLSIQGLHVWMRVLLLPRGKALPYENADLALRDDFACRIQVKESAPELLRRALSRAPVDLVMTGNYQPAERREPSQIALALSPRGRIPAGLERSGPKMPSL